MDNNEIASILIRMERMMSIKLNKIAALLEAILAGAAS